MRRPVVGDDARRRIFFALKLRKDDGLGFGNGIFTVEQGIGNSYDC
jgi:hypothetical protein